MKKIIVYLICLVASPAFAYNPSYNATNFAVMNAVIVSSVVSANIANQKNNCELYKQCVKYKGGMACKKYKCKIKEQTDEK